MFKARNSRGRNAPSPQPTPRRRHIDRAREAWKRYYHYRRLEQHGAPLPWHGRKAWRRVILTGLVLAAIIIWGLYHTIFAAPPDATIIPY